MENLLILLGFLLAPAVVEAQSTERDGYHPMLKEGKVWNLMAYEYISGFDYETGEGYEKRKSYPVVAALHGDTLINGNRYLKLYYTGDEGKYYHSAWREEGRKVYTVRDGETEDVLIFDFGMEINAISQFESARKVQLTKTDVVNVNGELFFRQSFTSTRDYGIRDETPDVIAVEGVGSNHYGIFSCGLFAIPVGGVKEDDPSYYESSTLDFLSCEEDGKVIFTKDDFNKEAYVEPTEAYQPMIKEGRTWRYTYHHWNHEDGIDDYWTTFTVDYTLRGDTIIDGRQCKKMYQKREGLNEKYYGAWYEDGRKVYVIYPNSPDYPSEYNNPQLFFDFGTAIGETSPTLWGETTSPLLRKEDINVYGQTMKLYVMHEPYGPGTIVQGKWGGACFVEGVGSMRGILPDDMTTCICDYETFDFCYESGRTIFTKHDFYRAPYEGAAEPYRQFLKSGKQWVYKDVKYFPYVEETGDQVEGHVEELFAVELSDPLLIDGKECYRMKSRDEDGVASTNMLWYEDGGKVYYVIDDDMSHPSLAFDFNLKKDGVTRTAYYDGKILGFEDFASNNLSFRRIIFDWGGALVEGIGHQNGILPLEQPIGIGYAYSNELFEACYEGDICIFTYNDFQTKGNPVSDVDGIGKAIVSYPSSQHGKTYDLQGRRLSQLPKKGVYIVNGKKIVIK